MNLFKRSRIPKKAKVILSEYDKNMHGSVNYYINHLKIGADDGWIKISPKEYKALLWMHKNKEKCANYIKALDGVK